MMVLVKRGADILLARHARGPRWSALAGFLEAGESLEDAIHREVREELGVTVRVFCILGTTHFYRGEPTPDNELIGVVYLCAVDDTDALRLSTEHDAARWVTVQEAGEVLAATDPSAQWIRRVIERAEVMRQQLPTALLDYDEQNGFELG